MRPWGGNHFESGIHFYILLTRSWGGRSSILGAWLIRTTGNDEAYDKHGCNHEYQESNHVMEGISPVHFAAPFRNKPIPVFWLVFEISVS